MTKNHTKTLVFTTLDLLPLKNWWFWKYLQCESFLFACQSCKRISWGKNGNKYLIFDSKDENKELLKNVMMFGMELKTKSKK